MHPNTVPCLLELAEEFDRVGPDRDTASDGSIGDQAHQDRSSNHNLDDKSGSSTPQTDSDSEQDIRAIDVDKSGPWLNGFTMDAGTKFIVDRCRSGVENRLVEVIYNRRCAYASSGWVWKDYTGSNAHTEHAHFGAKADTGKLENDRRPWGIADKWGDELPMEQDKFNEMYLTALQDPDITARHKKLAGQGTHNQTLGSGTQTIGAAIQGNQNPEIIQAITESEARILAALPPTDPA